VIVIALPQLNQTAPRVAGPGRGVEAAIFMLTVIGSDIGTARGWCRCWGGETGTAGGARWASGQWDLRRHWGGGSRMSRESDEGGQGSREGA
jgi:hypothetical protein